jgi:hypothetical protein
MVNCVQSVQGFGVYRVHYEQTVVPYSVYKTLQGRLKVTTETERLQAVRGQGPVDNDTVPNYYLANFAVESRDRKK